MSSSDSTTIPDEIQCFDVQEQNGELTARVGAAELRAAVDWLVAKGMADSRLKVRKGVARV
jgi:hypothetical protein